MDKIIFLDIDGVLNNTNYYCKFDPGERYRKFGSMVCDIDPEAIEFLNDLIRDTGAKIVISSTWRKGDSLFHLKHVLGHCGLDAESIIGMTPIARSSEKHSIPRGYEIQCWLRDNYSTSVEPGEQVRYVIFDDDSDMLWNQRDNYIQIDGWFGLSPNHCYRAKNILNDIRFF
jgi:hypothetical protein